MNELTPKPINLAESGMDQNGNFIMGQPTTPLGRLDRLVQEEPDKYPAESIQRVRRFVQFEVENPEKRKPYRFFESILEYKLYFQLHPEWQGKSTTEMREDKESGASSFYSTLKVWVRQTARTQEEREALMRKIFSNKQENWKLPGNTPRENEELGIRNIQRLFLEKFPEFNELFPRLEDGKIAENKREEARKYIDDKTPNNERSIKIFGARCIDRSDLPYFEGSFAVVKAKSFGQWGIEFNSAKELILHLIEDGGSIIELLPNTQSIGAEELLDYFKGNRDSFNVSPFLIREVYGNKQSGYNFYVGRVIKGKDVVLRLNERMEDIFENGNSVLAIPKEDEYLYYQWIDFYEVDKDGNVKINSAVGSYRVRKNTHKFEARGWYGPETQLFLDYIAGEANIDIVQLKEFEGVVTPFKTIKIGSTKGKGISIFVDKSSSGQAVVCKPKYDKERGYEWLEIYSKDEQSKMLASRRFYKGSLSLHEWKGSEVQSLIDWVKGLLSFDQARPIKINLQEGQWGRIKLELEHTSDSNISVNLEGNSRLVNAAALTITPKKDDIYEWIEVCPVDKPANDVAVAPILYRVLKVGQRKLSGEWPGSERQRLIDFLDGELNIDQLKPLLLSVGAYAYIYLFYYDGKSTAVSLNDVERFPAGTKVKIIPSADISGNLILEVWLNEGKELYRRYIFDRNDGCFRTIPEDVTSYSDILSFPKLDKATRTYIDSDGCWAIQDYFVKKFQTTPRTIQNLSNVRSRYGIGTNGFVTVLYNEQDVERSLLELQKLSKYRNRYRDKKLEDKKQAISSEEAKDVEELEEYEQRLLSGERLSYEEFMKGRQR